ncbi:MAG: spore coat protein [Lachnospiraceae bacterium]|nr:spore coat protein [Lachnospiraceae bacterium]
MQQTQYSEKDILTDALISEKRATEQYNKYAVECLHNSVRDAIIDCLEKEHAIQDEVFHMMHERGYYPTPMADDKKVEDAKQKFSQGAK